MDVPDALIRILALAPAGLVPLAARGPGRPPLPDTPEVALRSAERRRILEAVRETPGIHVRLLKRTLDMGGGEFDRNVDRLVSAGLLEKHRIASHARLYPAGGAPPADLEPLEGAGARRAA
ncbi:MAG TPA: hypothetical protein VHH36_09560, partial [Candidatus Thermoplasmatota archaeon]|nr:hypothetical protein [Candidatus Thermoplasmatota archaeon]